MVDTRIKPYNEQQAEKAAREEQTRVFRRNQVFGLLIVAAAILAWWLWHTESEVDFSDGVVAVVKQFTVLSSQFIVVRGYDSIEGRHFELDKGPRND